MRTRRAANVVRVVGAVCVLGSLAVSAAMGQNAGEPAAAPADVASGLDAVLKPGARVVRIVSGRRFTEGPVYVAGPAPVRGLLFSDIPADTVYLWTPAQGGGLVESDPQVFQSPSGRSNGLMILPPTVGWRGRPVPARLALAQHAGALAVRGPGGEIAPMVAAFEGQRLNSPNDLVQHPSGAIYFTDPPYGVAKRDRELAFSGVYRVSPEGSLTLLARDLPTPNGLAFSPDHKTLYVADSSLGEIAAFPVLDDGTLGERRLFASVQRPGDKPGEGGAPAPQRSAFPDGVKVDVDGRVYCAAAGGVWVFSPAGEKLGVIATPETASNLCFGYVSGEAHGAAEGDGAGQGAGWVLFITARTSVYAVPVKVAGSR